MENNFIDLSQIIINIGSVMPVLIMLMQGIVGIMGLYLVASGLLEFWGSANPDANKFLAGAQRFSYMSGFVQITIGVFLLAMATLQFVGIATRSITGEYVNTRMLASELSYNPGGSSLVERAQLATLAILGIMQALGFVAMVKGLMTASARGRGVSNETYGRAFVWFISGIICWNFKWFADLVNNTIGFNVMGLFPLLN